MIQNRYMLQSMCLTEKRYRNLLDHSESMVGIHVGKRILYANSRLRDFIGIPLDEDLEGRPLSDFIHPEDLEFVTGRMIHVYSTGEADHPVKERLIDRNGNAKEVMVYSLPTVFHGKLGNQFIVQPL